MKHGIQIGQAINPLHPNVENQDQAAADSPLDDGAQVTSFSPVVSWQHDLRTARLPPGVQGPSVSQLECLKIKSLAVEGGDDPIGSDSVDTVPAVFLY